MSTPPMIEVRGLQADYHVLRHGARSIKEYLLSFGGKGLLERKRIIEQVDLDIAAGECFGIVGRNGSGKSTLLRVLAGIVEPTAGSVTVRGRVAPMLALGVGLEPELDGLENARLCAALMGGDRNAMHRTVDHVRHFAGLSDDDLRMPVKRYSTGMMARLGFAIATTDDPEVLLIDEVLAVGDAGFQLKCYERIAELKRKGGTIVFVSHALGEVQRICDRAGCMEAGRLVKMGSPHEVGVFYHGLLGIPVEG
ncbi:MAG: ABC transporter ATP-binding protein [Flavobacteriales bacterium]|jgi:ABC-type polysaccharide/polyol phosphate transport system ATPase subunit|nr:ABC transporter ATP-binding protein [Flavobacteriales bacterium]MBK7940854.1 ABC transporter ATP-binding protein [Flavobacteriales bacterium]